MGIKMKLTKSLFQVKIKKIFKIPYSMVEKNKEEIYFVVEIDTTCM